MSYISKLDDKTSSNLEAIYRSLYNKWFLGEIEEKPFKLTIVKALINDLYDAMVEGGKING